MSDIGVDWVFGLDGDWDISDVGLDIRGREGCTGIFECGAVRGGCSKG